MVKVINVHSSVSREKGRSSLLFLGRGGAGGAPLPVPGTLQSTGNVTDLIASLIPSHGFPLSSFCY